MPESKKNKVANKIAPLFSLHSYLICSPLIVGT